MTTSPLTAASSPSTARTTPTRRGRGIRAALAATGLASALALGGAFPATAATGTGVGSLADLDPLTSIGANGTHFSVSTTGYPADSLVYSAVNGTTGETVVAQPGGRGYVPRRLPDGVWTVSAAAEGPTGPVAVGSAKIVVAGGSVRSQVQDSGDHAQSLTWQTSADDHILTIAPAHLAAETDTYQWFLTDATTMERVSAAQTEAPHEAPLATTAQFSQLPDGRYVFHAEAYTDGRLERAGDVVFVVENGTMTVVNGN